MSIKFNQKQVVSYDYETIKINHIYFEPCEVEDAIKNQLPSIKQNKLHQYQLLTVSISLGTYDINGKFIRSEYKSPMVYEFKDAEVEAIFADALVDVQAGKTVSRAIKNAVYRKIALIMGITDVQFEEHSVI